MVIQWVQSKYSKDAKKWEVWSEADRHFIVKDADLHISLPKSEYNPCDPPEQWEVCTREAVSISSYNGNSCLQRQVDGTKCGVLISGSSWAWSEKDTDALVVKRRVP